MYYFQVALSLRLLCIILEKYGFITCHRNDFQVTQEISVTYGFDENDIRNRWEQPDILASVVIFGLTQPHGPGHGCDCRPRRAGLRPGLVPAPLASPAQGPARLRGLTQCYNIKFSPLNSRVSFTSCLPYSPSAFYIQGQNKRHDCNLHGCGPGDLAGTTCLTDFSA